MSCSLTWFGGLGINSCCPKAAVRFVWIELSLGSSCLLVLLMQALSHLCSTFLPNFQYAFWAEAQISHTHLSSHTLLNQEPRRFMKTPRRFNIIGEWVPTQLSKNIDCWKKKSEAQLPKLPPKVGYKRHHLNKKQFHLGVVCLLCCLYNLIQVLGAKISLSNQEKYLRNG